MSDTTGYYRTEDVYLESSLVTKLPVPVDPVAVAREDILPVEIELLGGDWAGEDDEYEVHFASPSGY